MHLQKVWQEIIVCIDEASNSTYQTINPPAVQNEIDKLEASLCVTLPNAFKDYLFIMNGQIHKDLPLLGYHYFLSVNDIEKTWRMMNGLFHQEAIDWVAEDKIKPVIWERGWIPFTDFEATTRLILDLKPGNNGSLGQIFLFQPGMNYQEIIAGSFDEFSMEILKRLKQKAYSINETIIEFDDLYI